MSRRQSIEFAGWVGAAWVIAVFPALAEAQQPTRGTLIATIGSKTYNVSVSCDLFGDRYIQFRSDDTNLNEPVDRDGDGVVITGSPSLEKGKLSIVVLDAKGTPTAASALPFEKAAGVVTAKGKADPPSKAKVALTLTCE